MRRQRPGEIAGLLPCGGVEHRAADAGSGQQHHEVVEIAPGAHHFGKAEIARQGGGAVADGEQRQLQEAGQFAAIVQGAERIGAGNGEGGKAVGGGQARAQRFGGQQRLDQNLDIEGAQARGGFARIGFGPCDEHPDHEPLIRGTA